MTDHEALVNILRKVIVDAWDTNGPATPEDAFNAFCEAIQAVGYKLMPREPTEAMQHAAIISPIRDAKGLWQAQWDAAPDIKKGT